MAARGLIKSSLPLLAVGEVMGLINAAARQSSTSSKKHKATTAEQATNESDSANTVEVSPQSNSATEEKDVFIRRLKTMVENGLKYLALFGGVEAASRVRKSNFLWILTITALVQHRVKAFSWNLALYFLVRAVFSRLGKLGKLKYLLHPAAIFASHCVHGTLMVHHADWIEPGYIKLWISTLPLYNSVQDYLNHFSSKVIAQDNLERYQESQCSPERLRNIPGYALTSLKTQFPFVALVYVLPRFLFLNKTIKQYKLTENFVKGMSELGRETAMRVIRTSIVLCLLPYSLIEFPCGISWLAKQFDKSKVNKTKPRVEDTVDHQKVEKEDVYCSIRRPVMHVTLTALCSTPIFLAEPQARLEVMVGYTYWRILEAFIRKMFVISGPSAQEEYLSPFFTGLVAAVSSL